MEFVIRFAQYLETFRQPELDALATLHSIPLEYTFYSDSSPFCIVRLPDVESARRLVGRSILVKAIYELWGVSESKYEEGKQHPDEQCSYEALHEDIRRRTRDKWEDYKTCSFKFSFDTYIGHRTPSEKSAIIQTFSFLDFQGPVKMTDSDEEFTILEGHERIEADNDNIRPKNVAPPKRLKMLLFGRLVAHSSRDILDTYDLKKRAYISTTSMDAELTLITANIALASPGKLFYDPFVGTGSFCVAVAHFGAFAMGSDIDGRSIKGSVKGCRTLLRKPREFDSTAKDKIVNGGANCSSPAAAPLSTGVFSNFEQYSLQSHYVDMFSSDLTHTPLRVDPARQFFDGIVCDPPYGIREGLRVLGTRNGSREATAAPDGIPIHCKEGYVPPRKPYSFLAMIDDILFFASNTLVPGGRLSFWMPTANEEQDAKEFEIPQHPNLELVSVCTQPFNKWSRRLLTYRKLPHANVDDARAVVASRIASQVSSTATTAKQTADDLNPFRRHYFAPKPQEL